MIAAVEHHATMR